jgi:hypothetical protein
MGSIAFGACVDDVDHTISALLLMISCCIAVAAVPAHAQTVVKA